MVGRRFDGSLTRRTQAPKPLPAIATRQTEMSLKFFSTIFFLLLRSFFLGQTIHSYKSAPVEFITGTKSLYDFIRTNVILPDSVKRGFIGGTVFIKLDIDSFGNVEKADLLKGIKGCPKCDKEAFRVISILPKPAFKPQILENARVSSTFNLPIKFDLKRDSIVKYSDENLIGNWTFRDVNYKKCDECPDISFNSDHTAKLISDKVSWKIAKNELIISDLNERQRSSQFLQDSVYKINFSNYFKHLKIDGQKTSYNLTRD